MDLTEKPQIIQEVVNASTDELKHYSGRINELTKKVCEQFKDCKTFDNIMLSIYNDPDEWNLAIGRVHDGQIIIKYSDMVYIFIDFMDEIYTVYRKIYQEDKLTDRQFQFSRLMSINALETVMLFLRYELDDDNLLVDLIKRNCLRYKYLKRN